MNRRNAIFASRSKITPINEYSNKCGIDKCILDSLYLCNICSMNMCIRHSIKQTNNTDICRNCSLNPDYRDSIIAVNKHYQKKTPFQHLIDLYKILSCKHI